MRRISGVMWLLFAAGIGWPASTSAATPSETREQIISREDPALRCRDARLTVGRDGLVYLSSGHRVGYVLRLSRDGNVKHGSQVVYAIHNATANADGIMATANAHFNHSVNIYDREFRQVAALNDFLVSDQVGWDAPSHVEAGPSGDFYGVDQHRNRILQVSPWGKLVTAYPIARQPEGHPGLIEEFRVCEKNRTFYIRTRQHVVRCVGFDGKTRWSTHSIGGGAFDVDDEGAVYVIAADGNVIKKFAADGAPAGEITLEMGDLQPVPGTHITALRIAGSDAVVKRFHPTELFQTFDLAGGARKHVASIEYEKLTVEFPSLVWTAGRPLPFQIEFVPADIQPRWRVWATSFGTTEWRELPLADGQLQVPADFAGLYLIKVSPETQPRQTGRAAEYAVREVVEVRRPESKGTVNVLTPSNRTHFGRGEEISASIVVRAEDSPQAVSVHLVEDGPAPRSSLWRISLTVSPGKPSMFRIPAAFTEKLRPGRYRLTASAPGLTGVPQPLVIGPGVRERSPLFFMQYGDYGETYPRDMAAWEAADVVAADLDRKKKLGMNLFVDRLGVNLQYNYLKWGNTESQIGLLNALAQRLAADPLGVAPEKAQLAPPLLQTMAAYSAAGMQEMAILMANDAGLPLGTGFDNRKPEQVLDALKLVTDALGPYAAFRGWDWASNWWIFDQRGSAAAQTPEEKAAYEAALKRAQETGTWDGVLDRVADRRLSLAVEAQELFNRTLRNRAANLVTASACPFRNVESYPPVSLSNVDETDLQAQWEQIALPYHAAFGVDFYQRPGKRAWGHPEIWNDPGTGEQIVPTVFQLLMRGADGVGCSGRIPPWGQLPEDSRISYYGTASVYRALGGMAKAYGPWLQSLQSDDRVAIVVSGRMFKIDQWTHTMGRHFARVLEAYISCLAAHHPASIVFAEDLKPDGLTRFKAVLVVGQRVEFEPSLAMALRQARAAKVAIFHDGTCREGLVGDFTPLGISFDKLETGPQAGSDMAYPRFRDAARANVPAIRQALDAVTPPLAGPERDEVFVTRRKAEEGHYLFVVNNTLPPLDPGMLWRVTVHVASSLPARIPVPLENEAAHVYDVFGLRELRPKQGVVDADLRTLPARIFAVLPAAIDRVGLVGTPGSWTVHVQDGQGRPVRAAIPVHLRLLAADGKLVEERFVSAGSQGASGRMVAPINAPGPLVLEATELFSGKSARLGEPVPATAPRTGGVMPVAATFGPHIRELVLTAGDSLAVVNTMNWDHNLYAVDVGSGQIRWRQRVGHYFAFAPQPLADGVAVQGFNLASAEGYHLYLVGGDGKPRRGFALYGLPKRLPHRFVPSIVRDRINSFAVPRTGGWVAGAGDLGLAVWSRDGNLLWSQDWWKHQRHTATLAALDADTLLVVEGMKATAYHARDGRQRWQLQVAPEGETRQVRVSRDGTTCALAATTQGGRVFVVRNGRLRRALPTAAEQVDVSADGSLVAVTTARQLKLYSVAGGLQWIMHGDDSLHFPRISPGGKRVAASSALGTLYVLDSEGKALLEKDMGALAVPAWLPDGDLLLGTWMGKVCRLDRRYAERWSTRLSPEETDIRNKLLADDGTPITRIGTWGNAEAEPLPVTPNLLSPGKAIIRFAAKQSHIGFAREPSPLVDGSSDAPEAPWLEWHQVEAFAETSPLNYLLMDTFHTRLRVRAVTLVEDAAHPESWLRDATLEYWDAAQERWIASQALLSDAPVHTHRLATPIEAARFRLALPWGLCGNLRLAEIVLHGDRLGCSHPDAAAKRPVAVLFDEKESDLQCLRSGENVLSFQYSGAHSGTKCLRMAGEKKTVPVWQPPVGHRVPNWDFEIVEKPEPGQYRYLQFAWRALSPETKGATLRVAEAHFGGVALHAGLGTEFEGATSKKLADTVPQDWQAVRVDLWEVFKKPVRLGSLGLDAVGGPAGFDQVLLGRTEQDLPPLR